MDDISTYSDRLTLQIILATSEHGVLLLMQMWLSFVTINSHSWTTLKGCRWVIHFVWLLLIWPDVDSLLSFLWYDHMTIILLNHPCKHTQIKHRWCSLPPSLSHSQSLEQSICYQRTLELTNFCLWFNVTF